MMQYNPDSQEKVQNISNFPPDGDGFSYFFFSVSQRFLDKKASNVLINVKKSTKHKKLGLGVFFGTGGTEKSFARGGGCGCKFYLRDGRLRMKIQNGKENRKTRKEALV